MAVVAVVNTGPSGNESNEMPNIHGGFPRVPD